MLAQFYPQVKIVTFMHQRSSRRGPNAIPNFNAGERKNPLFLKLCASELTWYRTWSSFEKVDMCSKYKSLNDK